MSSNSSDTPEFGRRATPPSQEAAAKPVSEALRPQPVQQSPAPLRKGRSRASRSQTVVFLNFLMSLLVFAAIGAAVALWYGKSSFEGAGPARQNTLVTIKEGAGWSAVSTQLEGQGLVSNAQVFRLGVQATGHDDDLKAGEYEIPAGASMRQIVELLSSGRSIMQSLTIPEGLTVQQAWDRIAADPNLTGDMPAEMPPEGSLATDTQKFTRGTSRQVVIDQMLALQKKRVEEAWARRRQGLPVADVNEFVTLASIVEKETGVASERAEVAGVFVNRLEKGMRHQSDPTILYGLFGGKGRPADRPIYQSDIQKPTPYNTYTINGLPPGPIANPGLAALEAVANPAATNALYFVADGTGGHVFAETLDEHNRNVAKWRAVQRSQQNAQPGAGSVIEVPAPAPAQ